MLKEEIAGMKSAGYTCIDTHVHTRISKDAFSDIDALLRRAKELGIAVAITDHNEVEGAVYACEHSNGVLVIPGIEVKAYNGCDISVLFYELRDLIDYHERYIVPAQKFDDFVPDITEEEIITAAEKYRCVMIAVHPWAINFIGFAGVIERGVTSPDLITRVHFAEAVNGALPDYRNKLGEEWGKKHHLPLTAGSDAHIVSHLGSALTCVKTKPGEHPLDAMLREQPRIIAHPQGPLAGTLIFIAGQLRLFFCFPHGWKRFKHHLSICFSLKTRSRAPQNVTELS